MADDLLEQARRLSGVLTARGVNHAFIGGLAMNAWSIPAPTNDIDLYAELIPEQIPAMIAELDRAAIERLLAVQSDLDWGHVRDWAGRLGVTPRLEEALRESGLHPGRD